MAGKDEVRSRTGPTGNRSRQTKGRGLLGEPVVLTVGRLERYKNVDLIIDAFRALPYSAILFVVGDGPRSFSTGAASRS